MPLATVLGGQIRIGQPGPQSLGRLQAVLGLLMLLLSAQVDGPLVQAQANGAPGRAAARGSPAHGLPGGEDLMGARIVLGVDGLSGLGARMRLGRLGRHVLLRLRLQVLLRRL